MSNVLSMGFNGIHLLVAWSLFAFVPRSAVYVCVYSGRCCTACPNQNTRAFQLFTISKRILLIFSHSTMYIHNRSRVVGASVYIRIVTNMHVKTIDNNIPLPPTDRHHTIVVIIDSATTTTNRRWTEICQYIDCINRISMSNVSFSFHVYIVDGRVFPFSHRHQHTVKSKMTMATTIPLCTLYCVATDIFDYTAIDATRFKVT